MPELLQFEGDWPAYEARLYAIFLGEIAQGGLTFRGDRVSCRRLPETQGKWAAFWHLVQQGEVEEDRLPDLRRCERLRWVKYVIEAWNTDKNIQWWENKRRSETNVLLWYGEVYLVILAKRDGYWLLRSAYETNQGHRLRSLRAERDKFHGR
ncbi:MAG: hypothetical protein KGN34_02095 [Sphingomonadales bacterium]|nr:hypothetical protein [Sphingomonadales bacterium]